MRMIQTISAVWPACSRMVGLGISEAMTAGLGRITVDLHARGSKVSCTYDFSIRSHIGYIPSSSIGNDGLVSAHVVKMFSLSPYTSLCSKGVIRSRLAQSAR